MKVLPPKKKIGDYTCERGQWLRDQSVQSLATRIRARKKSRG